MFSLLEFYNKRLRHTRTVAVEELKTARQDMAVRLLNGELGHSQSLLRRDDKT